MFRAAEKLNIADSEEITMYSAADINSIRMLYFFFEARRKMKSG
jgi:hypothetical protein